MSDCKHEEKVWGKALVCEECEVSMDELRIGDLEGLQIELDYLFNIYSGFSKSKFIEMQARIDRLEAENTRLRILVDRTCGDGCHCMSENNEKCAALEAKGDE